MSQEQSDMRLPRGRFTGRSRSGGLVPWIYRDAVPPGGYVPATEQVSIRVVPPTRLRPPSPPGALTGPYDIEMYETAYWPCLHTALGAWCHRVYRWGAAGQYANTDRVVIHARSLTYPEKIPVSVTVCFDFWSGKVFTDTGGWLSGYNHGKRDAQRKRDAELEAADPEWPAVAAVIGAIAEGKGAA